MTPRYIFFSPASASWDTKYQKEGPPDITGVGKQAFVRTLLTFLSPKASVLDAGCGTGGLLLYLKGRGYSVTGVETSSAALETLQRVAPDIPTKRASIDTLPFSENTFDAVTAIGSWEYLPDGSRRAAAEAQRVLRPNGILLVEVPFENLLRRLFYFPLKRLQGILRALGGEKPVFAHYFFSRTDLQKTLSDAGFEVVATQPHELPEPNRHYGLWADWPFVRKGPQYELNFFGKTLKAIGNALSPWTICTGIVMVARKRP